MFDWDIIYVIIPVIVSILSVRSQSSTVVGRAIIIIEGVWLRKDWCTSFAISLMMVLQNIIRVRRGAILLIVLLEM
jgi:hypothetical protein